MTPVVPFTYPATPLTHRHAPAGYVDYSSFKPWLRDEFAFRCAYCLEREMWYPDRSASFSADHLVPQSVDLSLVAVYQNLAYVCTRCNSYRRALAIPAPSRVAYGNCLRLDEEGVLVALTPEGSMLIDYLHLNDPEQIGTRKFYLRLVAVWVADPENADVAATYRYAFGYPADLPDLRLLRPPGGNARPDGVHSCHFARRERGELPAVY